MAAPGADPMRALDSPLYIPRNPPDAEKPDADCCSVPSRFTKFKGDDLSYNMKREGRRVCYCLARCLFVYFG